MAEPHRHHIIVRGGQQPDDERDARDRPRTADFTGVVEQLRMP
jgi:hypothetical protein